MPDSSPSFVICWVIAQRSSYTIPYAFHMAMIEQNPNRIRLGRNIRILRERQGISLRKFAKMVSMDYAYLSNIENGKVNPTLDVISKIADGLDQDVRDLF